MEWMARVENNIKGQKLSEKYIKTDNDLNKKYFHLLVSVEFL